MANLLAVPSPEGRCTRCAGSLTADRDDGDNRCLKCLSCGKEHAYPPNWKGPGNPAAVVLSRAAAAPVHWTLLALHRLREILQQLGDGEALQGEAERIASALRAYGASDVPDLPWQTAKPKKAGRSYRPKNWGSCARCGVEFHGAANQRKQADGRKLCLRCLAVETAKPAGVDQSLSTGGQMAQGGYSLNIAHAGESSATDPS